MYKRGRIALLSEKSLEFFHGTNCTECTSSMYMRLPPSRNRWAIEYTHLSLLKIADTPFASSLIMLKRLREVKTALGSMVNSEYWSFWRKTVQSASKKVKDTVLDDVWWERVDLTIKIMEPLISCCALQTGTNPS